MWKSTSVDSATSAVRREKVVVGAGFGRISYQVKKELDEIRLHTAGEDAFDMVNNVRNEIAGWKKSVDIAVKVDEFDEESESKKK